MKQLRWTLCFLLINLMVLDSSLARPTVDTAVEARKLWGFLKQKEPDAEQPVFPVPLSSIFPTSRNDLPHPPPNFAQLRQEGHAGSFDSRFMSLEKPRNRTKVEAVITRRKLMASMPSGLKNLQFTVPGSERELGNRASKKLRLWLWNMSLCPVLPLWKDLGAVHWPRYVNIGQCSQKKTCSHPGGMKCKPKYKRIVTYSWYCNKKIKHKGGHCIWVAMKGDVVEKCKCSC